MKRFPTMRWYCYPKMDAMETRKEEDNWSPLRGSPPGQSIPALVLHFFQLYYHDFPCFICVEIFLCSASLLCCGATFGKLHEKAVPSMASVVKGLNTTAIIVVHPSTNLGLPVALNISKHETILGGICLNPIKNNLSDELLSMKKYGGGAGK